MFKTTRTKVPMEMFKTTKSTHENKIKVLMDMFKTTTKTPEKTLQTTKEEKPGEFKRPKQNYPRKYPTALIMKAWCV